MKHTSKRRVLLTFAVFLFALMTVNAYGAPVEEREAASVADQWYAMELNSGYLKVSDEERSDRFARLSERTMFYLSGSNELFESRPANGDVLGYAFIYQPAGYVIVTAEDRIEPVIAFDANTAFRWDEPDRNFLRHYIGRELPGRWKLLKEGEARGEKVDVHSNWRMLRERAGRQTLQETIFDVLHVSQDAGSEGLPPAAPAGTTYLLWPTALWDQGWPYNTTVVANNGNTSGVPTGCTATAMAIKMRFHEWPGSGNSSHSYLDFWGNLRFNHTANFGAQTYNWANMPTTNIATANQDVATLMYHAGVAVDMNYEVGGSGAWPTTTSMNTFFRYRGTAETFLSHETPMRDSIMGGLPVVMSSSVHTVVADGYRDTVAPYYHLNAGWGGSSNGWYSLSTMPGGDSTIDRSYPYSAPNNFTYVDGVWRLIPDGNLQNAYQTISQGVSAVTSGGRLMVKAGTYSAGLITISKSMTIRSYEGAVQIH